MKQKLSALCVVFVIGCIVLAGCKPSEPTNPTKWTQIPLDDPGSDSINLATFQGELYAITYGNKSGIDVWRQEKDGTWKKVAETGFGTPELGDYGDFIVYKGKMYISAGDNGEGKTTGQLWRSADGNTWEPVTKDGFGDVDTYLFDRLVAFKDMIYVTASTSTGLSIWRSKSGDAGTWERVVKNINNNIYSDLYTAGFIEFKGELFLVAQGSRAYWFQTPFEILHSKDGVTWNYVTFDGFGDSGNMATSNFAIFKNQLYLGTWHYDSSADVHSAELWRSQDGIKWDKVMTGGFGDCHNHHIGKLITFGGQLYAGTWAVNWENCEPKSGAQVWRSPDGNHWTRVNEGTFDNPPNWITGASVVFQDSLYFGVTTPDYTQGSIWKLSE